MSEKITRQQMWDEVNTGKRKLNWLFPYSNEALLIGVFAVIGLVGLGVIFGVWGTYSGIKALKDKNENSVRSYKLKAIIGLVLSVTGIFLQGYINLIRN